MTSIIRRAACALATASALAAPMAHAADAWPVQPINIVVPYSPGGGVDVVTRLITRKMAETLGQPIVVDNRPGAGTNIGMGYVARAKPDGYTLYAASNTITTNKALYGNLNFDPTKDFTAVGKIGEAPLVVVVHSDSPYRTLQELVDAGRSGKQELNFGTAGMGSSGHMASEYFMRVGGFKALHVPYKGGSQAVTDLLAGRLGFMAINPIEVVPHVQAGKLRALAVLNEDGTPLLPELKTAKSQGVDVASTVWWGIVAPAGTPAGVVNKLNSALNAALADPEVKADLAKRGAQEQPGTPGAFQDFMTRETATLSRVIEEAQIRAE